MAATDSIARATNTYVHEDFPVELRIGNELFKVASSRLAQHSPTFEKILWVNRQERGKPIILECDVDEFRDFLWYIHADPFAAKEFFDAPPSAERCLRLLGIANVAYQYATPVLANMALRTALEMLTADSRPFLVNASLALRLIRVSRRPTALRHHKTCVDVICDAMYPRQQFSKGPLEMDPIAVVELAQRDGAADKDVLAHAYFYVLAKGAAYWKKDERLTAVDRQRLLCGSHALYSPHESHRSAPAGSMSRDVSAGGWDKARVHADIARRRRDLWGLFNHDSWRLAAGDWGAEPFRGSSAVASARAMRRSSTSSGSEENPADERETPWPGESAR